MRLFLNIFLISFFLDSGLSVVNCLLQVFANVETLSSVQSLFSWYVILIGIAVYIASGINTSIPKKYLFPLIFFLLWVISTAQPLPAFIEGKTLQFTIASMQLLLSVLIFSFIKFKSGSWLITDNSLPGFSFSLKNTLGFFTGNILIVPVAMLIVIFVSTQTLLNHKTAGFLRLSTDGIYMKEKIYKKGNKSIKLIGMIHIGEDSYFKSLKTSLHLPGSILLAEGVSDKSNLIKNGFSTKGFAKAYGLNSQEDLEFNGEVITPEQFLSSDFLHDDSKLNIIRADVDISSFSQDTINFLNMAGEYIFQEDSFATGIREYNDWIQAHYSPSFVANIKSDIIDKRNKKVISLLDTAVEKFSIVIVPWGAMHMPAIETAVQHMGFSKVKTKERLSMKFSITRLKKIVSNFPDSQ